MWRLCGLWRLYGLCGLCGWLQWIPVERILAKIIFLDGFGRMIQRADHLVADGLRSGIGFAAAAASGHSFRLLPPDGSHWWLAVLIRKHGSALGVPEGFRRADAFVVVVVVVVIAGRSDGRRRRTGRRRFGAMDGILDNSGFRIPAR